MVLKFGFRGLMVPVFTPFIPNSLELNLDIIPTYSNYLKSKNVNGILVSGTTGEHVLMSTQERKLLAEAWIEATKMNGQTLMVQVGGSSLPEVLDMAKHAEIIKADALLCLPDLFFKPRNVKELIDYLKLVSNAAPHTPLFYYHFPESSGVRVSMVEFLKLGRSEINTLCGIKFTSTNLEEGAACLHVDDNLTIFLGSDTLILAGVSLGFDSAILATLNFWAEDLHSILNLVKEGKLEEAKSIQRRISNNIESIVGEGFWLVKMKAHMDNNLKFPVGPSRLQWQQ